MVEEKLIILPNVSHKDKGVLMLLSGILGQLGVDRFYRGQVGLGILKLITWGGCGIWVLIDTILYCVGSLPQDADGRFIIDKKTLAQVNKNITTGISSKDKGILLLFSQILGVFGADRFYRGQAGLGVLKLLTFGGCGIWALIDTILYTIGDLPTDEQGNMILDKKTVELLEQQ